MSRDGVRQLAVSFQLHVEYLHSGVASGMLFGGLQPSRSGGWSSGKESGNEVPQELDWFADIVYRF